MVSRDTKPAAQLSFCQICSLKPHFHSWTLYLVKSEALTTILPLVPSPIPLFSSLLCVLGWLCAQLSLIIRMILRP